MKEYCFGIDIGGTTVKCGLFNVKGDILEKWEIPTRTENNGVNILPDVAATIDAKIQEKGIARDTIAGVGVGIPGPVNEERSMGCHKLIYDGAGIAYTPEILLREMGIEYENPVKIKTKNDLGLATDLKLVYSCLDLRPKSMDFLIQKTGLPPEKIGSLLLELTLSGLALEVGRHYYIKTA